MIELAEWQEGLIVFVLMVLGAFVVAEPLRRAGIENEREERLAKEAYESKLQQHRFLLDCL